MATEEIEISELEFTEKLASDNLIPVESSTDTKATSLQILKNWLSSFFVGKTGNEYISGIKFFEQVIKSYQNNRVIERINKDTGKVVATLETQSSDPTNNGLGLIAFSEDGSANGSVWLRYNNGSPFLVMGNNFSLVTADRTQKVPTTQWVKTVMEQSGGMAQFNKNQNGYIKFLNGIIIQWGRVSSIKGDGSQTITLPTAFSSTNYSVSALMNVHSTAGNSRLLVINKQTSRFSLDWTDGSYSDGADWLAIGY